MQKIIDYIKSPRRLLLAIVKKTNFLYSDSVYLRLLYGLTMNRRLHLKRPITFTEKIQWLKLHDKKEDYTLLVDKLAVKKYVAEKVGNDVVIPVLGVWDRAEDIDFEALPDQFVLKVNCGGGNTHVCICRDKHQIDYEQIRKKLSKGLKSGRNIYRVYRESPYRNVIPKILAEQFIEDENQADLTDYKFYCFGGKVKYCQVIRNRSICETIDFYDTQWVRQPFYGLNREARPSGVDLSRPENYDKMVAIASVLSQGFPFLRVDLYNVGGAVYFGELTFYPASGLGFFTPEEYDKILGDLLQLPFFEKN